MKFLFDENLSPSHAARLHAAGHDAVAVLDIGLSGASDPEVRAAAIREGRVLVTLDADFGNILRYPVLGTPGVIWLRLHPPTEIKIRETLGRCLAKLGNVGLAGKLVVADEEDAAVAAIAAIAAIAEKAEKAAEPQ